MEKHKESNLKKILDSILIYNLYILIIGAILLFVSFLVGINGNSTLYELFQKLWYPIFIPSLSLFFTAILLESVINEVIKEKD